MKLCSLQGITLLCLALCTPVAWGQAALQERWLQVTTDNFEIVSQLSSRQTLRYAEMLENWRNVAAYTISGVSTYPAAHIPNYVYLFDDLALYQGFIYGSEPGFFSPTPRANFMAIVVDEDNSTSIAFHHYVHFLVRNFSDLRLPRWYEEGLAGYISRMQVSGNEAEFERFSADSFTTMVALSETLSMERLLFREEALASPRVIQIANLKSENLLHYLKHAYEEEGFTDRRGQLAEYLGYLLEGRNHRFAYDQSFDVTPAQLDEEFHFYLLNSRRPRGTIVTEALPEVPDYTSRSLEPAELAIMLAELALNAGRFEVAQEYFQAALDSGQELARSYSGLGDALRMQELEGSPDNENIDQRISRFFEQALTLAANDPDIYLDYGEYWEAELLDCDKTWPQAQRNRIVADIQQQFMRAMELVPDNPEANLAMGQLYLLPEMEWQDGREFQSRAFELLPADTFILEQSAKYAIAAEEFEEAERLINELAQPLHFWGEPDWVMDLRERLLRKRRGETYDACAND